MNSKTSIAISSFLFFLLIHNTAHSATSYNEWKNAPTPNYQNNQNLEYPYTESDCHTHPFQKIPVGKNEKIWLIDFWGEGRIVDEGGMITGFPDAYNINHQYQLVSNGPDAGRQIPNRIPVNNYESFSLEEYVQDNSVLGITLMGAPINKSCADEISRMIDKNVGIVIFYSTNDASSSRYNKILGDSLNKVGLYDCRSLMYINKNTKFSDISIPIHSFYANPNAIYDNALIENSRDPNVVTKILVFFFNIGNHDLVKKSLSRVYEEDKEILRLVAFKIKDMGNLELLRYFPDDIVYWSDNGKILIDKNDIMWERYREAIKTKEEL